MKTKHILLAVGAVTATAIAGTPYVAPAPAPEPAPAAWFFGGSYGQFEVDNNLDSEITNESVVNVLLGANLAFFLGALDNIEDQLDELDEEVILPTEEQFEEILGNLEGLGKDITEITLGDLDNALPGGFGLEAEVTDVDLDMYTLHFGRELGNTYGFDMAAYLEVGWLTGDMTWGVNYLYPGNGKIKLFTDNLDIDIIPVTANFKVERMFTSSFGAYLSAGLGYAWTYIDSDSFSFDDSGGGFYAQAAAGLVYNVNESFELFGGARWVHLESLDFGDSGLELEDTLGWEVGARYNF